MSKQRIYYSLRSFISYFGQSWPHFVPAFLGFLISNTCLAIVPVFVGKLVGALATTPIHADAAWYYVVVLIVLSSAHDITWRISEFLYLKMLYPILYEYENILFHMVVHKPYHYFVDKFTGKIGSYIGTIGEEFRTILNSVYWDYTSQVLSLISVIIILTAVHWEIGLTFATGVGLMLFVGRFTIRNATKYEQIGADIESTKRGKIIDTIANFVNVKSFQKETVEIGNIRREQTKTLLSHQRAFGWSMFFWGTMSFFVRQMIWPATIVLNLFLLLHHQINLVQFTTFISAILLFSTFIWEIIWSVSQFNLKIAKVEEAHQYLFGKVNVIKQYYELQTADPSSRSFTSSLAFHNLQFAYPDKPAVATLADITLHLKAGEKLGVVGKSGSGKTTLTKVLLGYYDVDAGQIQIDGQPIPTSELSQLISYVPQDTTLFHRTIAENIAYATDKKVTREEVVRAAEQAHADEFISQITDGYDALVGERGVKLSAGQRQRIAIARAFLDDQPILILDEATSALDSESEVMIQEALEALWEHKTVIAIAHRLSTLRHMDRIIVMENGRIIESGSHTELLEQGGRYAKLWSHQSGGFIEE